METVEAAAIGNELRPFLLEHLPDRPLGPLRMGARFRPGQTFVEEPGVQLVRRLRTDSLPLVSKIYWRSADDAIMDAP